MTSPTPSPSELTRAQLYERIRGSSKEEVVLTEMQRLGFWPADSGQPSVEADLIRRETELTQALQKLGSELHHLQNPEAALRMLRKERMAKAKARREETRQKRALARFDKAQVWHRRREHEVLYLGAGVSGGLNHTESDAAKLAGLAMPVLHKAEELAQAMGITLSELRFLAFERRVSRISHYRRFAMPKKTGGERIISAPMPRLKRAQYWVLDNVLARAPLHQAAHGFVPGRSIVSNAAPHVGQAVVINLDLKDFFPSIGMPRIKGVFAQLGYSEQVATILALLSTEAATDEVRIDGETFFVAHGERALPQGAPSSPALTNILCKRLDARLQACAAKLGFCYTRYADDLTFSGGAEARKLAGKLLWRAKQIVIDEGFTPHPDKQHVMRDAQRQMVTGIVVNQKPSLERETLRRFRATLFQVEKDGPEGKQWNGNTNVIDALEGYAQFFRMVDPARGLPLLVRVRAVRARWGAAGVEMKLSQSKRSSAFRALSAQGKAPWDGWWQATVASAPVLEKTAVQLADEKKARKAAEAPKAPVNLTKRAGAVATRPAASAPVEMDAPSAPATSSKPSGDNNFRVAIAVQAALVLAFALATQRVVPFICMAVIVLQSAIFRKPRWGWFIFIVAVWSAITLMW
ncbi:RNA-directed DNA polymerase [Massilia violaceinigra]|uniref:RNA-directed DNA polymerase n=1 Tax=Massilia violaceinigra TaxID=2045208 RepID=A0ABY4AF01_9BURK|nr:reverse transcriptase family protein [Massilia violaceinigra]UOD32977.1 RNA-directed DNA polymerase [Massilia violaceinigra]